MKEQVIEKAQDRLEILEEIDRLEREGRFDVDPEKDPPTIILTPENVDYLKKKSTSKISANTGFKTANTKYVTTAGIAIKRKFCGSFATARINAFL